MSQTPLFEHVLKYRDDLDPASRNTAKPLLQQNREALSETAAIITENIKNEKDPKVLQCLDECLESLQKRLAQIDEALQVCAGEAGHE